MPDLTPKEMRDHSAKVFVQMDEGLKAHNNPVSVQLSATMHCMQALWEIAAQLGELNERKEHELIESWNLKAVK